MPKLWVAFVLGLACESAVAEEPVALRELARVGQQVRYLLTTSAKGVSRPANLADATREQDTSKEKTAATLNGPSFVIELDNQLEWSERVLEVAKDGRPARVLRRMRRASVDLRHQNRPAKWGLRPDVSTLMAERRDGQARVFCLVGPLTRPELDLVQGVADPILLGSLLPLKPARLGERWTVGAEAARALAEFEVLAANALVATLKSVNDDQATLTLAGEVRGAARGAEGKVTVNGSLVFDRRTMAITQLTIDRVASIAAGPVDAALEMKSTTKLVRSIETDSPAELNDEAVKKLPAVTPSQADWLLYVSPEGRWMFQHDRDWVLFWEDRRQTVFKRVSHGELVAQCNLAQAPKAPPGRHQDVEQLKADIRRALGSRFLRVLTEGEVAGGPAAGFHFKYAAQGREQDRGVLWLYHLLASPEGEQVLVTFTLGDDRARELGGNDDLTLATFQWVGPVTAREGP